MKDVTKEEESKILRGIIEMLLQKNGLQLNNDTRHRLCRLADYISIPKEKVLGVAEEIISDFVLNLLSSKKVEN